MKRIFAFVTAVILGLICTAFPTFAASLTPKDVLVCPENGKVNISWKNPDTSGITAIAVVDGNGASVTADSINLEAGKTNVVTVSGLTNNTEYKYYISITAGGATEATEVLCMPVNKDRIWHTADGYNFPKWKYEAPNKGAGRLIDPTVSYEGGSSLKLVNNCVSDYIHICTTAIALDSNVSYVCKFWAKSDNGATGGVSYMYDWDGGTKRDINSAEWTEYTLNVSGKSSLILRLIVDKACSGAWFDDFRLYKIVDGEADTSENLFPNGGFELQAYDVNYADGQLTWTNPENSQFNGVNIYLRDLNGTKTKLNSDIITDSSFTVPAEYIGDESFELIVSAVSDNREGLGNTLRVLGNVDFYNMNISKTSLSEGELTVSRRIANNKVAEGYSAALISVLYHNDALIDVDIDEYVIGIGADRTFTNTITVPPLSEGETSYSNYELQIFLWDGAELQNIIKDMVSVK